MSVYEDLDWLPPDGIWLSRDEVADVMVALRGLVGGTAADEPIRSHVVTISYVVADAIERAAGGET